MPRCRPLATITQAISFQEQQVHRAYLRTSRCHPVQPMPMRSRPRDTGGTKPVHEVEKPSSAASAHAWLYQKQSLTCAHWILSRCRPLTALAQVISYQTKPFDRPHRRISRCPPAAQADVYSFQRHLLDQAHSRTPRTPPYSRPLAHVLLYQPKQLDYAHLVISRCRPSTAPEHVISPEEQGFNSAHLEFRDALLRQPTRIGTRPKESAWIRSVVKHAEMPPCTSLGAFAL